MSTPSYKGIWQYGQTYFTNDIVTYNGSTYVSLVENTYSPDNTNFWSVLVLGSAGTQGTPGVKGDPGPPGAKGDKGDPGTPGTSMVWRGHWSPDCSYNAYDNVSYMGSSYICISPYSWSQSDYNIPGINKNTWNLTSRGSTSFDKFMNKNMLYTILALTLLIITIIVFLKVYRKQGKS